MARNAKKRLLPPATAIAASALKTRTGILLRALSQRHSFLVLRRNRPVAILQSLESYVAQHPDEYYDVDDYLETWMEEHDPEFKRSLGKAREDYRKGLFLTPAQVRLRLDNTRKNGEYIDAHK